MNCQRGSLNLIIHRLASIFWYIFPIIYSFYQRNELGVSDSIFFLDLRVVEGSLEHHQGIGECISTSCRFELQRIIQYVFLAEFLQNSIYLLAFAWQLEEGQEFTKTRYNIRVFKFDQLYKLRKYLFVKSIIRAEYFAQFFLIELAIILEENLPKLLSIILFYNITIHKVLYSQFRLKIKLIYCLLE